jgi:predicted lipoprotein with Yx(FWY)xxD motif
MTGSEQRQSVRSQRSRRPSRSIGAIATTFMLAGSFAAMALATGTALTLGSASNSMLGKQVLVNAQGRTLYALSPETTAHLLCKSSECLKFWPPVAVRSRNTKLKAGAGVHGRLGILRRSSGLLQVTLRGLPLYRYSQDHARGEANGEGIKSFGGTWHAVTPAGNTSSTMPAAPTTPAPTPAPAPTTPTPGYGY